MEERPEGPCSSDKRWSSLLHEERSKKRGRKLQVSVGFKPDIHEQLLQISDKQGVNLSRMIELAVMEFFKSDLKQD